MAYDGTVIIGSELDDRGIKKGLAGLGSFAKKGFSVLGGAASIATQTIGAISAGLTAAGGAAVAAGTQFETSFAKASTLFGDVAVDTANLQEKILSISDATGVAANELNESLYSALSAGVPVTEDMGEATAFLESSAKLAKAGFTDMDTALSATAKTLNAYGMDISEADRINKILIQTQNKGITTVGELGASLAQVTPTAAAFGVSFENVGAALSNMTAAGTPTAQATTQLNSLIAELGKQGTMGAKALEKAAKGTQYAGMSFNEMMDAGVPLNEVLDLMQKSADDSGKSMVDLFSSIEAGKAALALSGENSEKFAANLEAMGTSADVVNEAYDKVTNTLQTKTGQIANSAKNLGIKIYQGMQGSLMGLADIGIESLGELSAAFQEGGIEGLIEAGAGIVADLATGFAEQVPALIDTAVLFLDTFIGSINENLPQLLAAGGSILTSLASGVMTALPQIFGLGYNIVMSVAQGIITNMPSLVSQGQAMITNLSTTIQTYLPQIISTGAQLLTSLASGIAQTLPTLVPVAVDAVMLLAENVISNIPTIIDAGIEVLTGLVQGIVNSLPQLIAKGPELVSNLCAAISENLPKIIQAGVELIGQLAAGIIQSIPDLIANFPQIIKAICDTFTTFNWFTIGSDILKGLAKGILGAVGTVIDAVKEAAGKIASAFTDFFDIHSPSKLMRDEVGRNIALGIAEGITQNADYAKKSAEDVAAAILQSAQKKLTNSKVYTKLSLADEAAYWDGVRKQVAEGTQARIDADKEYLQAKKSLDDKLASIEQDYADKVSRTYEELDKNIRSLQDSYDSNLKSRAKEIAGSLGLFDKFDSSTENTTGSLLENLQSQVTGLKEWSSNLKLLERRGVSDEMMEELRGLGVDAAGEIQLMTQMTDEELNQYVSLWKQKQRLARREAEKELEPLLESTQEQIAQMRADAQMELEGYRQEYVKTMSEIGVQIQQPLEQIQNALLTTVAQVVGLVAGTVSDEADDSQNISQFQELANSMIEASSDMPQDFVALGRDTIAGFIQGLAEKSGELYAAMAAIVNQTIETARDAAQIHSPSRVMRDLIGRNMIAGIGVGFDLESTALNQKAEETILRAVTAMQGVTARGFVAHMRASSMNATLGVDNKTHLLQAKDEDYVSGMTPTLVLEKGSIVSKVALDGKEIAQASAPYIDVELGEMAGEKERGR